MEIYLVIHIICGLLATGYVALLDKQITVGALSWSLLCGPVALAFFLSIAMFTHVDLVIWKKK